MKSPGFTLLESIIVILIVGILFGISIPLFKTHNRSNVSRVTKQLKQHLEFAKSVAVSQQSIVTVCGSSDAMTCDQQWHKGYIIFVDRAGKGVREEHSPVLAFQRHESEVLHIQWKGFLSREFIQLSPVFMQGQNGRILLSDDAGHHYQLIINSVGRIRAQDGRN